jgi:hypothetical protein
MRFGAALDLWAKGDPDAPQPPSPKERAVNELMAVCKRKGLAPADVGARFLEDHGISVTKADADTVAAFVKVLADE